MATPRCPTGLRKDGIEPILARDGASGHRTSSGPNGLDSILRSDIIMPGMDGLRSRARSIRQIENRPANGRRSSSSPRAQRCRMPGKGIISVVAVTTHLITTGVRDGARRQGESHAAHRPDAAFSAAGADPQVRSTPTRNSPGCRPSIGLTGTPGTVAGVWIEVLHARNGAARAVRPSPRRSCQARSSITSGQFQRRLRATRCGDERLKAAARTLHRPCAARADLVSRYGERELGCRAILPDTDLPGAAGGC